MTENERLRHCMVALEHLSMVVVDVFEEAEREGVEELMKVDVRARAGLPAKLGYDFLFSATLMKLAREGITVRADREDNKDCWRLVK